MKVILFNIILVVAVLGLYFTDILEVITGKYATWIAVAIAGVALALAAIAWGTPTSWKNKEK